MQPETVSAIRAQAAAESLVVMVLGQTFREILPHGALLAHVFSQARPTGCASVLQSPGRNNRERLPG